MSARFEVVRTAHTQWHARFVASNGRIVFVTENYKRKVGAERAIEAITGRPLTYIEGSVFVAAERRYSLGRAYMEVRYIDDRLKPMPRPELPAVGAS